MFAPVFYLFSFIALFFNIVKSAPHGAGGVYELNPPVTDMVYLTLEYYDVDTKQMELHDISIELYGTVVPKTVFNFKGLSEGVKALMPNYKDENEAVTVGYKGTTFHRIIADFMIQGGDVLPDIGPFSLHGYNFDDESFWLKHDRPGRLSMANSGPNTNACQFFITSKALPDLDGKHVVFGQVVQGLDVLLDKIQYLETENDKSTQKVSIKYTKGMGLKVTNQDELHKEYVEKATQFRNGHKDESNSVAFDPFNEKSSKSYTNAHTLHQQGSATHYGGKSIDSNGSFSLFDFLWFVIKVAFIGAVAYFGYQYFQKKSNSNKVVGLRHD